MKSYYSLNKEYKVEAVIFNLAKKHYNYWGTEKAIIIRWEDLMNKIQKSERPFIFEVTSRGIEKREF